MGVSAKYLGKETINAGNLGKKVCYKISIGAKTNKLRGTDKNIIYLTADAAKVPALIQFSIPVGTGQLTLTKALIVLAFIFAILGIVFVILPMGTLGVLPVGLSLLFAGLAYAKSDASNRNVPKWLIIVAGLTLVIVMVRAMMPDEVEQDVQFEQKKIESKQEDLQDLEGLE